MCSLLSVGGNMTVNEKLYLDAKNKIISLKEKGLLSELQVAYLLNKAREKLELKVEDLSIYL